MEHLSPSQIAELTADLQAAKIETSKQLAALEKSARPVDLNEPIGRLSRMDALQQQGLAQKHKAETTAKLARIEAALARIDKGVYGICIKTNDPIPFTRLKAMPEHAIGSMRHEED